MTWDQKRRPSTEYLDPHKARRILEAHQGICHICGHPDADQVDHVVPWSEWTNPTLSVHDTSNLAPAHGAPCPICGRTCHADKSKAEAARGSTRYAARGKRPAEKHPGLL